MVQVEQNHVSSARGYRDVQVAVAIDISEIHRMAPQEIVPGIVNHMR